MKNFRENAARTARASIWTVDEYAEIEKEIETIEAKGVRPYFGYVELNSKLDTLGDGIFGYVEDPDDVGKLIIIREKWKQIAAVVRLMALKELLTYKSCSGEGQIRQKREEGRSIKNELT